MQRHYPKLQVAVLAAGKGKRMKSRLPKVLHPVLGKSMLMHVLQTVEELRPRAIAVVTGHESEMVRSHVGQPRNLDWVIQDKQLGTAHAVQQCEHVIARDARDVLIVCGDTPLLRCSTLESLVREHRQSGASVTFLSTILEDPFGYGRVIRNQDNEIVAIVEEKDASEAQRGIREVTSGIYIVNRNELFELLHKIENRNAQKEYYLPDIVPLALAANLKVHSVHMDDPTEIQGINDRQQLALAEKILQQRIIEDWQRNGVTIEQPETVRIEASVRIGSDTIIHGGSQLLGSTCIGDDCEIGPFAVIRNSWIDDAVVVDSFSHLNEASVASRSRIGPYARLRPGAEIDENVRIGNFVEIKQSVIGRGTKVNHLTYLGDAVVGEGCNIGAGTITCNYDGANKHPTEIGDDVFIGSDTKLIAPVTVGKEATIGAGSIISKDVPSGGLTLSARPDQRHLPNWKRPKKKV